MNIKPISFKSTSALYTVLVEKEDGSTEEVHMTEEELNVYHEKQEKIKAEKRKEEELKKQQEWLAVINRPQKFSQKR
jgi:hypothetical protein